MGPFLLADYPLHLYVGKNLSMLKNFNNNGDGIYVQKTAGYKFMADINQFLRSKQHLLGVLHELRHKGIFDSPTIDFIKVLENSIRVLDAKIDASLSEEDSVFNVNFA